MKSSSDIRVNVMLLASVRSQKPAALGNHHQARLKAALECPGAAIAVTQGGEFLGMYDQADQALKAALAFLQLAEELPEDGRIGTWSGQAVMEVWHESADQLPPKPLASLGMVPSEMASSNSVWRKGERRWFSLPVVSCFHSPLLHAA